MGDLIGNYNELKNLALKSSLGAPSKCEALDIIAKVEELRRKKAKLLSPKSILKEVLGSLAGAAGMGNMLSSDGMFPKDIPLASIISMAASVLTEVTKDENGQQVLAIANNMQALWGQVGQDSNSDVAGHVQSLRDGIAVFAEQIRNLPEVSFDSSAISIANEALENFFKLDATGRAANAFAIQDDINKLFNVYGTATRPLFELHDKATSIKLSTNDLTDSLGVSERLLPAASNVTAEQKDFSTTNYSQQFYKSGVEDLENFLSRIKGGINYNPSGPGSQNAIEEISVIRGTCGLVDDFYFNKESGGGQGSFDWNELLSNFNTSMSTQGMKDLADRASNFAQFSSSDLTNPILAAIDEAVIACFNGADRNQTANALVAKTDTHLDDALTVAEIVATIYSTAIPATDAFIQAYNTIQQLGGTGALDLFKNGKIKDLFNMPPDQWIDLALEVAGLIECGKQSKSDIAASIIISKISELIAKSNVTGHAKCGIGDAAGVFTRAGFLSQISLNRLKKFI